MKKNYVAPQLDVIEMEVEGIICASTGGGSNEGLIPGTGMGSRGIR